MEEKCPPDVETDMMESLDINFASLFLRLAEVMKNLKEEKEAKEDGEKKEWWVQVEPAVPGQADSEAVLLSVFDFQEPFHLQLDIETYR